jgi:prepilin-type N-terminal cleavage/methylation domain-containing protein
MLSSKKNQAGFTLIEMIVSLAIFSIIVTITIGALLVLIASNQKLRGEQSVMTNLAFAMDSMTREIRTGTNYYCTSANVGSATVSIFGGGSGNQEGFGTSTNSCGSGRPADATLSISYQGVSFIEAGDSITGSANRILYYYDRSNKMIMRKVGGGYDKISPLVSSGLEIVEAEFFVSGASPKSSGDTSQPTVTVHIVAKEIDKEKLYYLQTTVTQRILDL